MNIRKRDGRVNKIRGQVLNPERTILHVCPEGFTLKGISLNVPLSREMTTDLFSISILAAGRGWLVAEKPSGLSVQEEQGRDLCSILRSRIHTDPGLRDQIFPDPGFGVLPVHRLDRETSGVILLACRVETFRHLATQFERRTVRKRYVALLHGDLPGPATEDGWGLWTWPLSREAGGRYRSEGGSRRVPSETRYRVLRRSCRYTLIECEPLTGRKHQIRRHARLSGHAVVGDPRYGTSRALKFLRTERDFHRLALHSYSLEVQLPEESDPQVFQSPAIPREMIRLLEEGRA